MKLRVGYVQCDETAAEGSLDQTLIRVMTCSNATNGGSVQTVYTNGETDIIYPKDPIAVDYPPPPPPPLPEDQPAETLQTITPTTTQPLQATADGFGMDNTLLIGGGLLLLFLLLGKNKKKKGK